MGTNIKCLWAKSHPRHPLWKHLLDASAVSLALPCSGSAMGWSPSELAFVVGLHDIGKADPRFQHQMTDFSDELTAAGFAKTGDADCRHERISSAFLKSLLDDGLGRRVADAVQRSVGVHHGHWNGDARGVPPKYEEAQHALCQLLQEALGLDRLPGNVQSDLSSFGMRLAGRVVLCDWIASNELFFSDSRLSNVDEAESYFAEAQEVANEWIETLGLGRSCRAGQAQEVIENPRPLQRQLLDLDISPGLVIVEAPMGEGKTEAAWIMAEKWRAYGYAGMYMALPTMATSDSLFARYRRDYLEKLGDSGAAHLVHGMAWLRDEVEPTGKTLAGESQDDLDLANTWFRPTRRAMLAPHGVGTVDQAMLAGMNVKFGFLRLYGLSDRVLVIDEVHAYDSYMSTIIARLLEWCGCLRIPVILLSATLSSQQRAIMIGAYGATGGDPGPDAAYPLITVAESGETARSIPVDASSTRFLTMELHGGLLGNATETAALAERLVAGGGCCCVVSNTVKQAQEIFRQLDLPPEQKLLFHARFTARDRERITSRVLELFGKDRSCRPRKHVLVATQVVEQSLDVDFDHMVTDIAPVDLLLQRSGRLHRHQRRDVDPVLHVLIPPDGALEFDATGYVYEDKPLLRTLALLRQPGNRLEVSLPQDFRWLIEGCYGSTEWEQNAVPWATIREADERWNLETELLESRARGFILASPRSNSFRPVANDPTGDDSDDGNGWRASTRLGASDRTAVLVSADCVAGLESGELSMKEVRDLYRQALKLPGYLPVHSPDSGYQVAVEAKGRLKGLLLLPVNEDDVWRGNSENGGCYEVAYDKELGLLARRVS